MLHPPYCPDLAPCNFWLFPTLMKKLRVREFNPNFEVISAVQGSFNHFPKKKDFFTSFKKKRTK